MRIYTANRTPSQKHAQVPVYIATPTQYSQGQNHGPRSQDVRLPKAYLYLTSSNKIPSAHILCVRSTANQTTPSHKSIKRVNTKYLHEIPIQRFYKILTRNQNLHTTRYRRQRIGFNCFSENTSKDG